MILERVTMRAVEPSEVDSFTWKCEGHNTSHVGPKHCPAGHPHLKQTNYSSMSSFQSGTGVRMGRGVKKTKEEEEEEEVGGDRDDQSDGGTAKAWESCIKLILFF